MLLYSHPEFSCKDPCLARHGAGPWHLFFSAFDPARSRVARVRSDRLGDFDGFEILFDGREHGWIGACSPDVTRGPDGWVLVCNSWGMKTGAPNALFVSTSPDLEHWSALRPLAPDLAPEARVIDGALAWTGACWMLACKWGQQARLARAPVLDGPWAWIAEQPAMLLEAGTGVENGFRHENFQLIQLDGAWHLLGTDYIPGRLHHHPWLYRLAGDPADPAAWNRWIDGRRLRIPPEAWNRADPDNAAALWDHRAVDGHVYLVYAGKDEHRLAEFTGTAANEPPWPRGWNRLGLAASADLVRWNVAG